MEQLSKNIIRWYHQNKRDLPWRATTDPYKIWLSEIILQQTRVNQGLPYYERFVEQYPTITNLAEDSEQNVLRLWQGLGYYSRARNLHATAKQVSYLHDGKFPENFESIVRLKGIGNYTAAAIASFAFNEKVAAVDGNVIRVLARYAGIDADIGASQTLKTINQLAQQMLPDDDHQTHNQAMMEFGALQCTPRNPGCDLCPLNTSCKAYLLNQVDQIPLKVKKIKKRDRYFNYIVLRYGTLFYLQKREAKDIWTNLYEFHQIETPKAPETSEIIDKIRPVLGAKNFKIKGEIRSKKHVLSHQNIFSIFVEIELFKELDLSKLGLQAYTGQEVRSLPKPILINNYLDKNIFS